MAQCLDCMKFVMRRVSWRDLHNAEYKNHKRKIAKAIQRRPDKIGFVYKCLFHDKIYLPSLAMFRLKACGAFDDAYKNV